MRNAPTQSAMPATTVTTTMTTMVVVRSSDPSPPLPLELLDAVLDGPRVLVGSPVSCIRVRVSSGLLVVLSMIKEAEDVSSVPVGAGRLSDVLMVDVTRLVVEGRGATGCVLSAVALPSLRPGVRGCVSSMLRSASTHRIWIAGPTVTSAPAVVAARAKPQTPPRKSVTSVVQVNPTGTQYATVSPGAMAGNPSSVRVLVMPQLGPTTKPRGQMAGE